MAAESPTASYLSVAMTTNEAEMTPTTGGNGKTSSSSSNEAFYFQCVVIFVGVVGTAGNALILYALVVSKQYKKHMLILNQNALDLFSCFFLVVTYSLKLCNIHLTGTTGYWLCMTILSENFIWWGTNGSTINLAIVTVDRYLKVIHPVRSKKLLRSWVIYSAMAFAWFVGIVYNTIIVFATSVVIDGVCYGYFIFENNLQETAYYIWYLMSFYVIILLIFIFCYWRILVAIRRQASVMAGYSGTSATVQAESHQMQSNVIKTMIFVSVFYAITWLPGNIFYFQLTVDPTLTAIDSRYYVTMFTGFCYTCANPFIYATKFNPVRKVLAGMIPCKKMAVQPAESAGTAGLQLAPGTDQQRTDH